MQENINIPDSTITTNLSFRQLVLMNMQQLTNFPYIEKDFDALTDYELLCLVVKFLNDVIANQNEQNDTITRLYNAFLQLQDYVNNTKDTLEDAFNELDDYVRNYFANLDVQDEINNKLDEMVEDGTLVDILENYFNTKFTKEGMINIIDYGAKCDGETDDTVAVKNAIADLGTEVNGVLCKTLIIPGKTVITDKLTIDVDGITIKGYNINSCQILFKGENAYLEFKKEDNSKIYESQIRDLYIRGNFTQDQLILFYNCVNIYLNRVYLNECEASQYLIKFTHNSNIIFINECILDSSEDITTYPAISNGLFLESQPAIFTFTKNNCWNMAHVIDCQGVCLNTNIQDNWIENCNVLFYHSNTNDLRYVNLNIENNTFSVHSFRGYVPSNVHLIDFNETSGTNMWNSFIKIKNNNFYFYNIDNLYNNTLINFSGLDASGTVYIAYAENVYSGKTLSTLQSYVVNIPSGLNNTIKFTEIVAQAPNDSNYITNVQDAISCLILSTTSDRRPSAPRGLYLCKTSTNNNGLIYYDTSTNKFVGGYNGTLETFPKKWTGETIPYPITSENYITALNAMARVINNAGVGVIQSN